MNLRTVDGTFFPLYVIHALMTKLVALKSTLETPGAMDAWYVITGRAFSTTACPDRKAPTAISATDIDTQFRCKGPYQSTSLTLSAGHKHATFKCSLTTSFLGSWICFYPHRLACETPVLLFPLEKYSPYYFLTWGRKQIQFPKRPLL